jgi:ribosomal protein S18 acetylase RimI-like enzyme
VSIGVRLGPLAPVHRDQLEAIVRATNVFAEDEVSVALELFDQAIGKWTMEPDYEFVGAFDPGGALIGYACFGATPSTDNTFDLYWIAVSPSAQRSGAGGLLMSEVERRLTQRRARLLVVETSSRADYGPTRRFYQKRGYEQAAQLRDFYAPGDDRVVLTKHLAAALP